MTIAESRRLSRRILFLLACASAAPASGREAVPSDHRVDLTVKGHVFLPPELPAPELSGVATLDRCEIEQIVYEPLHQVRGAFDAVRLLDHFLRGVVDGIDPLKKRAYSFPHADGSNPPNVVPTWRTYVGRVDVSGAALCPGSDGVTAAPVVQLYNFSDATFQSAFGDDIVYVITHYSGVPGTTCAGNTTNRVYALNASTGAIYTGVRWPINVNGSVLLDYGSQACTLHYGSDDSDPLNNTLYCGTARSSSAPLYQHSVHVFNSITGAKKWGKNIGSVVTSPQLRNGRVYAVGSATLYALDANNSGATIWSQALATTVTKTPWVETRSAGGFNNYIFLTDGNSVDAVLDQGSMPSVSSSVTGGTTITTAPAFANVPGKVYVGMADGTIHQLDFSGGRFSDLSDAILGSGPINSDIALDALGTGAINIDSLTAFQGTALLRYAVPWPILCK